MEAANKGLRNPLRPNPPHYPHLPFHRPSPHGHLAWPFHVDGWMHFWMNVLIKFLEFAPWPSLFAENLGAASEGLSLSGDGATARGVWPPFTARWPPSFLFSFCVLSSCFSLPFWSFSSPFRSTAASSRVVFNHRGECDPLFFFFLLCFSFLRFLLFVLFGLATLCSAAVSGWGGEPPLLCCSLDYC